MEFPERSKKTTDDTFTWDEVRKYLDEGYMDRAKYVARILLALSQKYGDEVFDVAKETIYEIGYEKGQEHAATTEEKSLEHLLKFYSDKVHGLYFGYFAELSGDKIVRRTDHCPMPRQWKQMGMTDDEIVLFCSIFDYLRPGIVEGYGEQYSCENTGCRTLAEKGYCQMIITKKS